MTAAVEKFQDFVVHVRHCEKTAMDIHISYDSFGEASDPCVLLVMGLNGQGMLWPESLCESIAAAGYYVIRYDNRDVGLSTKVEGKGEPSVLSTLLLPECMCSKIPYTLDDMAHDAIALLDVLNIQKAHVVGLSMGGMIVQLMAVHFPERVLTLTSIMSTTGAASLPKPAMWVQLELMKAPKSTSKEDMFDFRMNFMRKVLTYECPDYDNEFHEKTIMDSIVRCQYQDGVLRHLPAILRTPPRDEMLKQVKTPSLVIHGGKDVLVPYAHGIQTAQCLQNSKFVLVPTMGHAFNPKTNVVILEEMLHLFRKH